jgi:hypothetical protein
MKNWCDMHEAILSILLFASGLAVARAQTVGLTQNSLTNQDVVALAKAGFNEDFLIDLIGTSRTRFDTSADGLAELAKQGLTEPLIRAMLNPPAIASRAPSGLTPVTLHDPDENRRKRKTKESVLAIENRAPYYRSSSLFWGLWKSKIRVGANSLTEPTLGSPLGAAYGQVRLTDSGEGPARYALAP